MPDSRRQNPIRLLTALAVFTGLAAGHAAVADALEPAATQNDAAAPQQTTPMLSGPQVYNTVCIACHAPPGVGGAPALGNAEAWAPRIAQGMDTLFNHALNGFSGNTGVMPRKGERLDLSDEEVIGAVEFMVEQVSQ